MKIHYNPTRGKIAELVLRPQQDTSDIEPAVRAIMDTVRTDGDSAVIGYTQRFDGVALDALGRRVIENDLEIAPELRDAILVAQQNIAAFHEVQREEITRVQTMPGVECWRKSVPIDRVGLYVPGGSAPLFSSLLMLGVPARIAGCREIVVMTPPDADGGLHPAIAFTADAMGISTVYLAGGAQAIAAMTYGTETVPRVDKIFGPGNRYVTLAKQIAQRDGVAIDMPAGPSEVLVIADESANPAFVAADLLSQAEHGPDSQVVLATNSDAFANEVIKAMEVQLSILPRKSIAQDAISNSFAVVCDSIDGAMDFSNAYAPEHLIINTQNAEELAADVRNAGSVFIGPWSCESIGDYASGTNHTLPTHGYAHNYSGVSLDSFMKKITFQHISPQGLEQIGPHVEIMARAEELAAHERAVSLRLQQLANDKL